MRSHRAYADHDLPDPCLLCLDKSNAGHVAEGEQAIRFFPAAREQA